jgi:hypothetical protein
VAILFEEDDVCGGEREVLHVSFDHGLDIL